MSAESFAQITVVAFLGHLLPEAQGWVPRAILMLLGPTLWPKPIGPQLSRSESALCESGIGLREGQIVVEDNWIYCVDTQEQWGSHLLPCGLEKGQGCYTGRENEERR